MKIIVLLPLLLLTGCFGTAPVKHALPEPPKQVIESCPGLGMLDENEERLSELLKVVTQNYTKYHECATKHDYLVKWYRDQKAVHDAVFNKDR